jgi:hypothetical protein
MALPAQVVEGQQTTALSLIDSVNLAQVSGQMQKISQFQAVVQKTLRQGHDYGVIPGTGDKPVLLKPGAEKILMLMGVTSEYELIERIQDYDNGFFAYTVKCVLSRHGQVITEGLGHCNTREKKYRSDKQDPYTLANTCLKMAKKRAQIDATLTIASLSDVFTQDLEDMYTGTQSEQGNNSQQNNNAQQRRSTGREKPASDAQLNLISRKAKEKGLSDADVDAFCMAQVGKHVDELTSKEASQIITALDKYEPKKGASDDDPFADDGLPNDDDLPF